MTSCSVRFFLVAEVEVHAPDLLELAALSRTRMAKRKTRERFWKYCLAPALSGFFTKEDLLLLHRWMARMKFSPGLHKDIGTISKSSCNAFWISDRCIKKPA